MKKALFLKRRFIVIIIAFAITNLACLWDNDTVEMERQDFPQIIELITGKFLRHSPEFYYWRIKQKEAELEVNRDSLELYDNIAVAYSKLHQDKKAIKYMQVKEKLKPGLYETYANLGTFYIHNNQLDSGLVYIRKAIELNPDAHFGREIYQQKLVEYVLYKKKEGITSTPLCRKKLREEDGLYLYDQNCDFSSFLIAQYNIGKDTVYKSLPQDEMDKAIRGISGMMRFGNYNSPVLLEALGDLLTAYHIDGKYVRQESARNLAMRAYLHAMYKNQDPSTNDIYLDRINSIGRGKGSKWEKIEKLSATFKAELAEGKAFYEQIRADEINWIKSGLNVEEEFRKKYYDDPELSKHLKNEFSAPIGKSSEFNLNNSHENIDSGIIRIIDSLRENSQKTSEQDLEMKNNLIRKAYKEQEGNFVLFTILIGIVVLFIIMLRIRYARKRGK